MDEKLLGVKINYIRIDQAIEIIEKWLQSRGKHYVVTPNPEMIIDSLKDQDFKTALNEANLAIPDSPRLGWASKVAGSKTPFLRLFYLPFFLFPGFSRGNGYPTTSGVDLMESLISLSQEKALTTAYLGGSQKVADKLFKCLRAKYPKLKIKFCSGNVQVNQDGVMRFDTEKDKMTLSKEIRASQKWEVGSGKWDKEVRNLDRLIKKSKNPTSISKISHLTPHTSNFNAHTLSQKIDILFVAFGHPKQEKWMHRNINKLNVRVMMGVGGSFDYLSGSIPRAPVWMRELGLEWLFRVIVQPLRIKRLPKLFLFVYKVMTAKQ